MKPERIVETLRAPVTQSSSKHQLQLRRQYVIFGTASTLGGDSTKFVFAAEGSLRMCVFHLNFAFSGIRKRYNSAKPKGWFLRFRTELQASNDCRTPNALAS